MNTRVEFGLGTVPNSTAFATDRAVGVALEIATEPEVQQSRWLTGSNTVSFAVDISCAGELALRLERLAAQVRAEAAKREAVPA